MPSDQELHSHEVSKVQVEEAFFPALRPRFPALCALSWAGVTDEEGKAITENRPNLLL